MTTSVADIIETERARVAISQDTSGLTINIQHRRDLLAALPTPFVSLFLLWNAPSGIQPAIETLTYEGFDIGTRIVSGSILIMLVVFCFLLAAAVAALGFWSLYGEEELHIGKTHVSKQVSIGVFRWRKTDEIAKLNDVFFKRRRMHFFQWLLVFGGKIAGGVVGLKFGRKKRYFGANLDEQQAQSIIRAIRSACPQMGTR